MSSPGSSSRTPKPADLFEDLWRKLGECHQNALQELEEKVNKLKKERCLDAQRLELFYKRNQQLKEQNKTLQDAVSLFEERLRAGECDRCAILEENLKNSQDQNERLITKLKHERKSLEDENRKLHAELQKLKMSRPGPQSASSPEQEDSFIPGSPILPSSLPAANKLKKRRNLDKSKHVRYAEMPLPQSNNSLFSDMNKEPADPKNPGRAEVLVPNTCELDTSQILKDDNMEEVIAETCGLELLNRPDMNTETTEGRQSNSKSPLKCDVRLKPYRSSSSSASMLVHSPDSTTLKSPSLLPRVKRISEEASISKAKRKKEEGDVEMWEEDKQGIKGRVDKQTEDQHIEPEPVRRTSAPLSSQSFKKDPSACKVQSAQNEPFNKRPNVSCTSPTFKKPNGNFKERANQKRNPLQDLNNSHVQHDAEETDKKLKVEPMWSIDPALALSMYDSEEKEEQYTHGELADTDVTWVSHSLLQRRGEESQDREDGGLGEKANDSLDQMFDTTAYGEYKSFSSSHVGKSQPCAPGDEEEEEEEEGEEEEEEDDEDNNDPPGSTPGHRKGQKAGPTFAHVVVVRKKDERRKLQGATCKECEVYYAHLPEEEKQKKLSECSRHRFLYIPPCTPENFWEIGFPSTQTCIDRGYIKEEKNPKARLRRRQPFNVLFSPKRSQQESQE